MVRVEKIAFSGKRGSPVIPEPPMQVFAVSRLANAVHRHRLACVAIHERGVAAQLRRTPVEAECNEVRIIQAER
jgi:hypothetical protein